jgi:hypothetical protein
MQYSEFRKINKVQKPSTSERYTPLLQFFSLYEVKLFTCLIYYALCHKLCGWYCSRRFKLCITRMCEVGITEYSYRLWAGRLRVQFQGIVNIFFFILHRPRLFVELNEPPIRFVQAAISPCSNRPQREGDH